MKALLRKLRPDPGADPTPPDSPPAAATPQKSIAARRRRILAIDLGKWASKAAYFERRGQDLVLVSYYTEPSVCGDLGVMSDGLADHLASLYKNSGAKTKRVVITLSMGDAFVRNVEMPHVKVSDLRRILKFNPQQYMQQDLRDYVFDCCVLHSPPQPAFAAETSLLQKSEPGMGPASKIVPLPKNQAFVLAGGAPQSIVTAVQTACEKAGLILEELSFSQIGLANAVASTFPEATQNEVCAIVDVGFKSSTISILAKGELALTRVVTFGGDKLTASLAEAMNSNYRVAEAIKVTMPEKIQEKLGGLVSALGRELRAAIDFFEHQYELPVQVAYLSGASARSQFIVQLLERELMIPTKTWNPAGRIQHEFTPNQESEFEANKPQLGSAIGAAIGWLNGVALRIDLLAEKKELEGRRWRDPLRWSGRAAAVLVLLFLIWGGALLVEVANIEAELSGREGQLDSLHKLSQEASNNSRSIGEIERTLASLKVLSQDRFFWAGPLNALQYAVVDDVQLVRLRLEQIIQSAPPTKATTNANRVVTPARPASVTETIVLSVMSKDYATPPAAEKFVQALRESPYFQKELRPVDPILLRDRLPEQIDPFDPTRTFTLFKLECFFNPRVRYDE
ncbi:MAG: pilus assembly protein PilM [Verrucomicrobiota bacterium]